MKVIVAKTAGFCKGVKDALEVTLEAIQKRKDGERICTYGPVIHNRQVLAMLEEKGIREVGRIEDCAEKKVVIRAHGIPPDERQALHRIGATLLDATCKRVAKVHAVIKRHARQGFHTVIVGDADHAEVLGLMGYTGGQGIVIHQPEQVDELPEQWGKKVLLVAQTTQNEEVFQEIRNRFLERFPEGTVKNTICGSTHARQAEVRELCSRVEAMVIVGGYHSGNTVRLAEVARECAIPTYHIETETELDRHEMARYATVGVSAGASTPNWIIRNVVDFLEGIEPERSDLRSSSTFRRTLELLVYGNVYVAVGAALLSLVVQALVGLPSSLDHSMMAACYAFAMHSLNIYLDRNAIQLNDPNRAAFYQRWRFGFTGLSITGVLACLWIALAFGIWSFIAMVILVAFGTLYAVPLILPGWWERFSAPKIKDIPTSKTFSVALAWGCVIAFLPYLSHLDEWFGRLAYAFWIIFLMVLIRTALLDLLAVQGDRLVGKETLVVALGEEKTARFIKWVLAALTGSLILGPFAGLSTWFTFLILPAPAVYNWHLKKCFQTRLKEDPFFEAMIESVFIALGALALLWSCLSSIG
jgi:4-hydroxy-3-methylbut-2-enyl diphosphate reductase